MTYQRRHLRIAPTVVSSGVAIAMKGNTGRYVGRGARVYRIGIEPVGKVARTISARGVAVGLYQQHENPLTELLLLE